MNIGTSWENKTPNKINKHPNKLFISKIWSNKIQAAIVAKTPSKEKIIADGAGEIFFYQIYFCLPDIKQSQKLTLSKQLPLNYLLIN